MDKIDLLNAVEIGEETTIGSFGELPRQIGNCFSLITDERKWFDIVNFYVENLRKLLDCGLEWPVKIIAISNTHAVICDERIPEDFYRTEYCQTCCPEDLLPYPQRMKNLGQELRGDRAVKDGLVNIKIKPQKDELETVFSQKSSGLWLPTCPAE